MGRGCPRQHLCAFHHRRAEKRNPPHDTVDYNKPLSKDILPSAWAENFLAPPLIQEKGMEEMPMMGQMGGMMMYGTPCWPAGGYGPGVGTMDASVPLAAPSQSPR